MNAEQRIRKVVVLKPRVLVGECERRADGQRSLARSMHHLPSPIPPPDSERQPKNHGITPI
jgi:hypothetical protein